VTALRLRAAHAIQRNSNEKVKVNLQRQGKEALRLLASDGVITRSYSKRKTGQATPSERSGGNYSGLLRSSPHKTEVHPYFVE
jgi:hypothetical protein